MLNKQIAEAPRPLYGLGIRTHIHCGNLTLKETKEIEVRGLSDLRSFICPRNICCVPDTGRNVQT